MSTRLQGRSTLHHVEATGPGGDRLSLEITARKRHTGSVRVIWDPTGELDPHFPVEPPWGTIGLGIGIITLIVAGGWLVFG